MIKIIEADETGTVTVEGGHIWYRRNRAPQNSNHHPLLIIHGGPGSTHDYMLPCSVLAADRDVVFYDQLDSGRSARTNDPSLWTLERFASEIPAIKETLAIDQFHILASSWGCSIATYYAAQKPQGLLSLTLSGALINTARWLDDNEKWRQQLPQAVLKTLEDYETKGDYDNAAYNAAVLFFYHRHLCRLKEWPACVNDSQNATNIALYRHMWGPTEFLCTGTLKNLDLTPSLAKINTPTLFISGEFDEGTYEASQYFAGQMPNATAKMIKNGSHMPHVENFPVFQKVLNDFFKKVEGEE